MYRPILPLRTILLILLALTTSMRVALAEDLSIVVEAGTLLETIDRLEQEYAELKAETKSVQEVDGKAVAELQARRHLDEWMRSIEALVANVLEQREQGVDESGFRQETRKLLWALDRRLPAFIDEVADENAQLRGDLADASIGSRIGIEARIRGNEETLDETVRFYLSHIDHMDRLELGSSGARSNAAEALEKRAGQLAARLEFASQKLEELQKNDGGGADSDVATRKAQDGLDRIAASLWTVCDALDELGLPTYVHR